ncbi:MAG: D-glycero-alpha-D-manno-heptose-7-phosphate kinase [Parcubacteria group bacterium Gr01-1014_20]|nr:MAG: D-glycero-alpha-D-manno-heptose-7-phosphate kinase [Parcubacteria group bacterium Gr01-1014_20]
MIITRTPFRISFFGGGTDYPAWYEDNGGAVLSASINNYCYITCRYLPPFFDHKHRLVWSRIEAVKHLDEIQHPTARETLKFLNVKKGVEIHHDADLPARSGLGSSSAFTVGLIHALHALQGRLVTKRQLAFDAINVEQDILKENVGSQDQVATAFGGFNKIEFGGPQRISVFPVTMKLEKLKSLESCLLLFFTGLTRNASDIAAEQIRRTPEKSKELQTMKDMVNQAVSIIESENNFDDFGRLLHENWKIKRQLTSQVTNKHIDEIYEAGRQAGALGGKLLGAGGGGFMLFYVRPEFQSAVKEKLKNLLCVPVKFENIGSQVIYYGPSDIE